MTRAEWRLIAGLVDEWWPGKFERNSADAWFVALENREAQSVLDALKMLLARGGVHRPSLGEVVGQLRAEPSRPTFDEAYRLIYGPGGVLGFKRKAKVGNPWVLAFVERFGVDRLRLLEVDSEDYGEVNRRALRQSWEQFVEAMEGRDIAALTLGKRRGGMAHLDPLAALVAARPEINEGKDGAA